MDKLLWVIPALPLLGFLTLLPLGRRLGEPLAGWFATATVGGSFVATVAVFFDLLSKTAEERRLTQQLFTWIPAGNLRVSMGFLADPLSITMCLFVTGVSALIHLYSIGYMRGDEKFAKFFMYLNLFVFAMLMLVLGDNLLVTFLGWEGVGACSYFLVAFWHTDPANATAGKKAFVVNRIGDWGFMVGTFLVWSTIGSIAYVDISAGGGLITGVTATAVVVLFLVAATGKSAQLPLYVWLPDAMAGPTPVSALIHAATMVTSGLYLLVRLHPILANAGWANDLIAWIGVATAMVAATIAIGQDDIKKVLAYSTVSQLGFMFLAVGTGNYVAAVFHVITHAFFKALMFLGSGSVILGMEHEQSMRWYGNLRRYMPITAGTFIVGWLAIAGIPPFSGFWSKDEILAGAWGRHDVSGYAMWALGLIAALFTAFYMTRLVVLTFFGEERWRSIEPAEDAEHAGHGGHLHADHTPKESPSVMTLPLLVLGGLALVGGVINLPFSHSTERLAVWLEPVIGEHPLGVEGVGLVGLAVVASLVAFAGVGLGALVYVRRTIAASSVELDVFAEGWYIDSTYARFVGGPGRAMFDGIAWFDSHVIDGAVNGVGIVVARTGQALRRFQSGQVRGYAVGMAVGAALLLGYVVTRIGL